VSNWLVLAVGGILGLGLLAIIVRGVLAAGDGRFWVGVGLGMWRELSPGIAAAWIAYKACHTDDEWRDLHRQAERQRQGYPGKVGGVTTGKTVRQHTPPIEPTAK
jgi:hypothetical protein